MSLEPGRYRFNGSELVRLEIDSQLALYVADSWLSLEGQVVALDRHFARFAHNANAQGLVQPVDDFLGAVIRGVPKIGAWFPRIELTVRGELQLLVRPAPERAQTVALWSSPADPRTEPSMKGPDIPALESLREEARAHDADEAVITSAEGFLVDGATTCLLWWRDNSLHTPPAEFPRVNSVTVSVLRDIATERGVFVAETPARASDLEGQEVWAVNALHGIRPVTRWIDGPELTHDESRLRSWRAWYENTRQS